MKKSFWKVSLFFAAFFAIGLLTSSCSKDDDGGDVSPKPVAKFSHTVEGLKVTFKNESSKAKTYVWDFGDTNTSTEKDPVHVYAEAGTYTVKLTAKGDDGEATESKEVKVAAGGDNGGGVPAASITLDGDFSDWDEVPEEILFTAVIDEDLTNHKAIKEMKVTSDDMYIFLYFKLDTELANAMDIYINNDLSAETGYNAWMWESLASNFLLQGFYADNYDMRLAPYDESKDGAWGWLDDVVTTGSGLFEISEMKPVSGTVVEFEGRIIRDFIPGLNKEIRIAAAHSGVAGDNWATSGGIPMVPAEGDKNEALLVKLK